MSAQSVLKDKPMDTGKSEYYREEPAKTPEGGEKKMGTGKEDYDQISKDGDSLQLSKPKISDMALSGYSEARLKQLFQNKRISRQQYDKAIKSKKTQNV